MACRWRAFFLSLLPAHLLRLPPGCRLLVLLASIIGLSASEPAPAFGYDAYEPLVPERAV